jgi:hypothetical protein
LNFCGIFFAFLQFCFYVSIASCLQAAEAIEEQRRIEAEAKAEVERKRQEEEAKLLIYEEHDYTARPWQSLGSASSTFFLHVFSSQLVYGKQTLC